MDRTYLSRSRVGGQQCRSIVSFGSLGASARSMAKHGREFMAGLPPPTLQAAVISRMRFVNSLPRRAS
jgi:hypothetical protein